MLMSKLTLFSFVFLLVCTMAVLYLLMSYTYYLMVITMPPGTIPRFLRVRMVPFSVYFLYITSESVHEHRE